MEERIERHTKRGLRTHGLLLLIGFVFFSILLWGLFSFVISADPSTQLVLDVGHRGDNRTVFVAPSIMGTLNQTYNESLENGFCLYGRSNSTSITIEHIEHVDAPFEQTDSSVSFTCIPETVEQGVKLFTDREYGFIGHIHTHPDYPGLSRPDTYTFGMSSTIVEVMGIYDDDGILNFFSPSSLTIPLDMRTMNATS